MFHQITELATQLNDASGSVRREYLLKAKAEIDAEISEIDAGNFVPLTFNEKTERVAVVEYYLNNLEKDFSALQQLFYERNLSQRRAVMENEMHRGEILGDHLDYNNAIRRTPEYESFQSFSNLLRDEISQEEIKRHSQQIETNSEMAKIIDRELSGRIKYMINFLTNESFKITNQIAECMESLKNFISRSASDRSTMLNECLQSTRMSALDLGKLCNRNQEVFFHPTEFFKPIIEPFKTFEPQEESDELQLVIEKHDRSSELTSEQLSHMKQLRMKNISKKIIEIIEKRGPSTFHDGIT